ncbi:MAG: signal peptidase I, partial [Acidimicrobiales bacterium]
GDTVEGRDGQVLVNGRLLVEPYLDEGVTTGDFAAVEIPEGCIWVMGDNRGDSRDSRSFGPIDESQIVGRAFVRVWPLNDLGLL